MELLITVALILVLTTMYWGSSSPSRRRQQRALCQKNLQTIYIAMEIYAREHSARFPQVTGARTSDAALDLLVPKYTADTSVFTCPASKDSPLAQGKPLLNRKISYAYYMGRQTTDSQEILMTDRQIDTEAKTAGQGIFSSTGKPPGNNHQKSGGNLLYCDGHTEAAPAQVPFAIGLTQGVVLLNPKH
jgi:prepilin-type processing-associated H-X9-DG protein